MDRLPPPRGRIGVVRLSVRHTRSNSTSEAAMSDGLLHRDSIYPEKLVCGRSPAADTIYST